MVFGIFIGFTLIPGLCHLIGTSKTSRANMHFDETHRERRDLENEKLRAEIEYYKSKLKQSEW